MHQISIGLLQVQIFTKAEKVKEVLGEEGYGEFVVRTFMLPFDGPYLTELLRVYMAIRGLDTYENMKDKTPEELGDIFKNHVANSKSEE